MPIYAYKCGSCGHAKDVLQKISDAPLTVCPACGAETFSKQVTAAGFQLKGSGWYVTDFRGGNGGGARAPAPAAEGAAAPAPAPAAAPAPAPAAPAAAPAAPPPRAERPRCPLCANGCSRACW
ncbi:zinc ribbon domain-containing protein [Acidovorax citrulli]|nr:zinc ribbon domain-containing protein [Paracidovorax citrulli]